MWEEFEKNIIPPKGKILHYTVCGNCKEKISGFFKTPLKDSYFCEECKITIPWDTLNINNMNNKYIQCSLCQNRVTHKNLGISGPQVLCDECWNKLNGTAKKN